MTSKSPDPFALHFDLSKFAKAVNYYLSYIELVAVPDSDKDKDSRPHFITESAVRFPLAEYLERRLNVSDLELEFPYPKMKSKRCDFKFSIKGSNDLVEECLAEIKYVKSTIDLQDFFDDLMRLHFARKYEPKTKTFFIVCGKTSDFTQFFKNKKVVTDTDEQNVLEHNNDPYFTKQEKEDLKSPNIEGILGTDWLSFSGNDFQTMNISSPLWHEFELSHFYKLDRETKEPVPIVNPVPQMPNNIITRKICIAGGDNNSEHSVGIWEVF